MVDRGPNSADVIAWAMKDRRVTALMGNHEHMLLDYYAGGGCYSESSWAYNGGAATRESYMRNYGDDRPPESHLTWLKRLPVLYRNDNLIATHAPINHRLSIEQAVAFSKPDASYEIGRASCRERV